MTTSASFSLENEEASERGRLEDQGEYLSDIPTTPIHKKNVLRNFQFSTTLLLLTSAKLHVKGLS